MPLWSDPPTPRVETRSLRGVLIRLLVGMPLRDVTRVSTATFMRSKAAVAKRGNLNPCRDWPGWLKLSWRLLLACAAGYALWWRFVDDDWPYLVGAIGFLAGSIGVLVLGFTFLNSGGGKKQRMPAIVRYDAELSGLVHVVPVGKTWNFGMVTIDLLKDPHLLVSADTGQGKSSLMTLVATWVRKHGGSVNIIDPKKITYLFLRGIQGVDVWTDEEDWIDVIDRFYHSMMRTYDPARLNMEPVLLDESEAIAKPFHLLQIDEMGTFVEMIEKNWERKQGKGRSPTLTKLMLILWLGRAASHILMVGAHQANAKVVLSTDSRAQFRNTLGLGPQNARAASMLFGEKRPYKPKKRIGRGLLYSGGEFIDLQAWFVEMTEYPQVTRDQQKLIAELKLCLPVVVLGQSDTHEVTPEQGLDVIGQTTESRDELPPVQSPAEEKPIVGRKMAADYLGISLDTFDKRRHRLSIPGTFKVGAMAAWWKRDLDEWEAMRVRGR